MKDAVVRFCVVMFNVMSVVLMIFRAQPASTLAERFLRGFLVMVYLASLISLATGGKDEDNNKPSDDV